MIVVGSMTFEVIRTGKGALLRLHARPYGHQTPATQEELLTLARYVEDQALKLYDDNEAEQR